MHITQSSKRGHSKQPNQTALITLQTLAAWSVEREERVLDLLYILTQGPLLQRSVDLPLPSGKIFMHAQTQSHQTSRHIAWGHMAIRHIYPQYIDLRAHTDSICVRYPRTPITTATHITHEDWLPLPPTLPLMIGHQGCLSPTNDVIHTQKMWSL